MSLTWPLIYAGAGVLPLVLSLILTPRSRRLGERLGLLDRPAEAKIHTTVKARSGGIAIFLSFMLTVGFGLGIALYLEARGLLLSPGVAALVRNIPGIMPRIAGLLAGAVFIFIVGIIDDRFTLGPWTKLLCQVASAMPLLAVGIRIQLFLPSAVGMALTVFWVVLLTNSMNFLDNMDGLSSGIAIIVALMLAIVSSSAGERFITMVLIVFAGAVGGFWYHNFIRSRLFMGDGGSLFIGYILAAVTIMATYFRPGVPTALPVLTPLIILGVPLFDTITVLYIRYREGRPLMKGDTNHFSHRLVQLGMSRGGAVIFIYFVTISVAMAALPLSSLTRGKAIIQTAHVILWFLLIFLLEDTAKKKASRQSEALGGGNAQ
ncbi:MAG TPA: MraY family glycosyltransferase [Candidatus Sumerlaeota bacterium]|nr:MraY family glycosyltransferase [Candidatus Sumerlaeota bacterium]